MEEFTSIFNLIDVHKLSGWSPERVLNGQLVGADDPRLPGRGWPLDSARTEAALSPVPPQRGRAVRVRADRPEQRVLVDAGVHLTPWPASLLVLVQGEGDWSRETFLVTETIRIPLYIYILAFKITISLSLWVESLESSAIDGGSVIPNCSSRESDLDFGLFPPPLVWYREL